MPVVDVVKHYLINVVKHYLRMSVLGGDTVASRPPIARRRSEEFEFEYGPDARAPHGNLIFHTFFHELFHGMLH